ncbi:MAG: hypothetical protein WD844_16175 [Thermoleophilaceae bacterium]
MCAQCMAAAATTAAAATGIRAWLAARKPGWLTPARLRSVSAGLLATAVIGAGLLS